MSFAASLRPRPRERGVVLGQLEPADLNAITDVAGVRVGQVTIDADDGACVRTGVTVVLPHERNMLDEPVPAAVHVINAFGKAIGTTQVDELGIIETPIVLTNTFSVGAAYTGVVQHALRQNGSVESVRTLNPLVLECNDGWLNEIAAMRVEPDHVLTAIEVASGGPVAEGAVGAGRGMLCFGWKGGIGPASRRVGASVLGTLVLANFGARRDLVVNGVPVGRLLERSGPRRSPSASAAPASSSLPSTRRSTHASCDGWPRGRSTASGAPGRTATTAPVTTPLPSRRRGSRRAATARGWTRSSRPRSKRWKRR